MAQSKPDPESVPELQLAGSGAVYPIRASSVLAARAHKIVAGGLPLDSHERVMAEALLESAPNLVVWYDAAGRIRRFNGECERVTGWTAAEVVGRPFWEVLVAREEAGRVADAFRRMMADDGPRPSEENSWVTRTGQRRDIVWRNTTLCDETGSIEGVVAVGLDVTDHHFAVRALRESEARFARAFYASPDPYVIARYDSGEMIDVNEAFCRTFGIPRDEAIGRRATQLGLWVDMEERERFIAALRRDGEVRESEQLRRARDGRILVCRTTAYRIEINGEACILYRMRDVTRERAAEQALRESEERFSKVFRASADALAISEFPGGPFLEVNDAYCAAFGFARAEMVGRSALELNLWETPVERDDFVGQLERDGEVRDLEVRLRSRAGTPILARINAHVLTIGGKRRLFCRVRDITRERAAEIALLESEEKFSKAFRACPSAVAICSADDCRVLEVNEGFTRLHGWTRAEAVGRSALELDLWADLGQRDQALEMLRTRRAVREFPILAKDKHGGVHHCLYFAEMTEIGGRSCIVAVLHDITEQQRLEEQLRHAQRMESIGRLAGGVAHDFNNILTVIQGHAALLRDDIRMPGDVLESLEEIKQSAEFASNLTRQLLLFSRKQAVRPDRQSLNEIVTRLSRLLHRVIGEDIALEVVAAPRLPDVNADAGMIEQVLLNLVVNARDAMPNGGRVTVSTATICTDADYLRRVPQARLGSFVGLRVRDTGEGIPPDVLPRIFEPFFTTKAEGKGTGLGLATVYGIVDQHHGWIEVESKPGDGAQFTVWIPALPETGPAQAQPVVPESVAHGRETILVAEDKDSVRNIMRSLLMRQGYRALIAGDGREAAAIWEQEGGRIDLLLTDVVMPGGVSGCDLAARFRREKPDLRVIYCSGYGSDLVSAEEARHPLTRFVSKPFDVRDLAHLIRSMLDLRV